MSQSFIITRKEAESLNAAIAKLTSILNADSIPWEPNSNTQHRRQVTEVISDLASIYPLPFVTSPFGSGPEAA